MSSSIKKNFLFSSILTVSSYLFPLLTFPYVTRVLGVKGIGIYNFVDSVIQYFVLFSSMGIATVGIREISRAKSDKQECSKVFSSLLTLNLSTTTLAVIVLVICTHCIPQLREYQNMMYIGIARLLGTTLLIEWLYKGLEKFKYITFRTLIIRTAYVICVFIFVKDQDDYIIYFALTALMVVINAIINSVYSQTIIRFSLKSINIKPYIKPFITLGVYQFLTSMYISFNVAYLGFVCGETEVGLYTTATKLFTIILSFYTAFTGVMLPRMSSIIARGQINEFKGLAYKSLDLLFSIAFPLLIISEVYASE